MKVEDRTEPWPGACGVYHPLLSEALVKFQAETMMETFPAAGPVKTKIIGKETPEKKKAAERVQEDMNYQLTEVMVEYRPEHERMLWGLGLAGNAFKKVYVDVQLDRQVSMYCPAEDVIAWDEVNLVPRLQKNYGDLGVGLVVAHEWGHAIQVRAGVTNAPTIFMEQQADCYAGAWVADARRRGDYFQVDDSTLDVAITGFLELRDPVGMTNATTPGAHGSAFDRIRAFQEGVDDGVAKCASYQLDELPLVAIDYQSYEDYASGGNLPLADSVDLTVKDLQDFWAQRAADLGGTSKVTAPKVDVQGPTPTSCKGLVTLAAKVTYCPSTNTVSVPPDLAAKAHQKIGDFALSALIGAGWSAAVLDSTGTLPSKQLAREETANCLAGAWTRSVFDGDREGAELSLSPGDLDEAVSAMLGTRSKSDPGSTGTGFDRVTAYRQGFTDGVSACTR